MAHTNTQRRSLTDYPRPSIAVDPAILTITPTGALAVLIQTDEEHRLPGTFLHEHERLEQALSRGLKTKTGLTNVPVSQLGTFDDPHRDSRGWVISVAYFGAVPYDLLSTALQRPHVEVMPVDSALAQELKFDHAQIITAAVTRLRQEYQQRPDPYNLIGAPEFTLLQLMDLHAIVAGGHAPLLKDTFRRRMSAQLEETGNYAEGTVGKPAKMYRKPATHTAP